MVGYDQKMSRCESLVLVKDSMDVNPLPNPLDLY